MLRNEGVVIRRRRGRKERNERRRRREEQEEEALNGRIEATQRDATRRGAYAEKKWKGREEEKEMDISVMTSRE